MMRIPKNSLFFFLCAITSMAYAVTPGIYPPSDFDVGFNYRQDDLKWKVKAPEDVATYARSVVKFRDRSVLEVYGNARRFFNCWLYGRAYGGYGWILEKKVHEKDSFYDPVANDIIVGQTVNKSKIGTAADASIGIGNPFQLMNNKLTMAFLIGFAYHTQKFRVKNKNTIVDAFLDQGIPYSDLTAIGFASDSGGGSFRSSWWGPWGGADLFYYINPYVWLYGEVEYHFASRFHAQRKTHTGYEFFDHYHHTNSTRGGTGKLGFIWLLNRCTWLWRASFNLTYCYFTSHRGEKHRFSWHSIGLAADLGINY